MNNSILIFIILFTVSCLKQSAPSLSGQPTDEARNAICGQVDFINSLIEKDNLENLFQCLNWNSKFPNLYNGISKTSKSSWNKLAMPVNDSLLKNRDRRDRIFGHIKALDQKGALDDLSDVVKILNQTNVLDGIGLMFKCSENDPPEECKKRGVALNSKDLEDFLEAVNYDSSTVDSMYSILYEVIQAIQANYNDFKTAMSLLLPQESFNHLRIKLIDVIMQEYLKTGIDQVHIESLAPLLNDSQRPFLYRWITSDSVDSSLIREMYLVPFENASRLRKYVRSSSLLYKQELECSGASGDDLFKVNLSKAINGYIDQMINKDYRGFMTAAVDGSAIVVMTKNGCEELSRLRYPVTYYDVINNQVRLVEETINVPLEDANLKIINYIKKPQTYDLLRTAISGMVANVNHQRVIDVFANDITDVSLLLLKTSEEYSPELSNQVMLAAKQLGPKLYNDLYYVLLKSGQHKAVMKSLAKAWLFLTEEEKNHVFKFIDYHYKIDVNAIALFEFYAKVLYETRDISIYFQREWLSSESDKLKTVLSVGEVFFNLSGKSVLAEMEEFFSRDHVLKIITILSRGVNVPIPTLAALTGRIIPSAPVLVPDSVVYKPMAGAVNEIGIKTVECLSSLSKTGLSFYNLIESLPNPCLQLSTESFIIDAIKELGIFSIDYGRTYARPAGQHSLFDSDGILRRDLQNMNVAISVLLGSVFDSSNATVGINKFLTAMKIMLFEKERNHNDMLPTVCADGCKGFINLFERMAIFIDKASEIEDRLQQKLRTFFITQMAEMGRAGRFGKILDSASQVLSSYSEFYKTDKGPEILRKVRTSDCKNVLRSDIGADPCPDIQTIHEGALRLIDLLLRSNEEGRPTAIELISEAMHPAKGLNIPFDMRHQRKYVITIEESLKMIYSFMDVNFRHQGQLINQSLALYQQKGENNSVPRMMTTGQRIEVVIRDIRFDNNYLGAHYMNSVARAEDYDYTVNANYSLLKTCALGLKFCGKFFSKDEKRMVANAIETYPSLLEANSKFGYGNYMQTLLQIFVASSSKIAAKSAIVRMGKVEVPYLQTKKQLEKHNGKILTELSMLSVLSNSGRVLHDRLARNGKAQFISFVESDDFRRIDKFLLKYVNNVEFREEFEKLLLVLKSNPQIMRDMIEFVYNLSFENQQIFENTFYNLLQLMTYVGPAEILGKAGEYEQFKDNNSMVIMKLATFSLKNWNKIKIGLPASFKAENLLRPINNIARFTLNMLKGSEVQKSAMYTLMNESVLLLKEFFFKSIRFEDGTSSSVSFILEQVLKDTKLVSDFVLLVDQTYELFAVYHNNQEDDAFLLSSRFVKDLGRSKIKFTPFYEYLEYSTSRYICLDELILNCSQNPHFDEPYRIIKLLAKPKEGAGMSRFQNLLSTLFKNRFDDLVIILNSIFPALRLVQ